MICKLDEKLDNDIPDNDNKYFLKYGPDYELKISPSRLDDNNTENDMEIKYKTIKGLRIYLYLQETICLHFNFSPNCVVLN